MANDTSIPAVTMRGVCASKIYYDEGYKLASEIFCSSRMANTTIIDVNVIVPEKVVEVTFANGGKQKAVCQEGDIFSLEHALSICICKNLMGGSSSYNKSIKTGLKVHKDKLAKKAAAEKEKERITRRKVKREAYRQRCEAKAREARIEEQKEAYLRAMQEASLTHKCNCK